MRKITLMLVLVSGLLLSVAAVSAQDATPDPDADFANLTFTFLKPGEEIEGEFTEDDGMVAYGLGGTEGDVVTISMTPASGSDTDPFLVLLGPNGEVLAYNDDVDFDNGDFSAQIADVELPVTGLYFVLATTFYDLDVSGATGGAGAVYPAPYVLVADGFTEPDADDPDLDLYTGFTAEADDDGSVTVDGPLTIDAATPVFYIFFPAQEGQSIDLSTALVDDSDNQITDTMVYVFDSVGVRIAVNDDNDDGLFAAVQVDAPDSGMYMAFITSYGFWDESLAAGGDVIATLSVK